MSAKWGRPDLLFSVAPRFILLVFVCHFCEPCFYFLDGGHRGVEVGGIDVRQLELRDTYGLRVRLQCILCYDVVLIFADEQPNGWIVYVSLELRRVL